MKKLLVILLSISAISGYTQDGSGKDSTAFLDSIMGEMDAILDDMFKPKSFVSLSLGAGTGFFNFKSSSATQPQAEKKLMLSPSVSYLHKSGLGLSVNGYMVAEEEKMNAYQVSFTPSYDYIRRGKLATGVAFTRYQTKKDLSFYTTPIQNEAYAYFNYREPWLQPGVAVTYGWGSRTSFEERKLELLKIRRKSNPTLITIRNDEEVNDFSTLFSLRHDFTWSGVFSERGLFTLTPVMLLSAGTQSFGFNTSFQSSSRTTNNFLPNNQHVKDKSGFDTQSATFVLRGDYSHGIFFVQSQVLFDYYLHTADRRLNNAVAVIAGVNF